MYSLCKGAWEIICYGDNHFSFNCMDINMLLSNDGDYY